MPGKFTALISFSVERHESCYLFYSEAAIIFYLVTYQLVNRWQKSFDEWYQHLYIKVRKPGGRVMSKGTILIIEDNLDNLFLVRFLLEEGGFQVASATDGRTGLEMTLKQQPCLVLLDLSIPEINGWNLAEIFKSNPDIKHIPVVALTAHALPGDRKKALDAGCDGYISKPLDIANFVQMVEEFLIPVNK
jgi:two-component system, cell cycle response regulator DivK